MVPHCSSFETPLWRTPPPLRIQDAAAAAARSRHARPEQHGEQRDRVMVYRPMDLRVVVGLTLHACRGEGCEYGIYGIFMQRRMSRRAMASCDSCDTVHRASLTHVPRNPMSSVTPSISSMERWHEPRD